MKIGKIAESVLKRSVLRQLKTKREEVICGAGVGDDCAIFSFAEGEKMVTCMQEGLLQMPSQVSFPASGESDLYVTMPRLIHKCVNNLAVSGAEPVALAITLLLPATVEEPDVKQLIKEAEHTCQELSLQIVGGQTRVTASVNTPLAVITGYGKALEHSCRTAKSAKAGQDIVISKWIGLEGTSILARRNREKLLGRYPAYLVEEASGFDKYFSVLPEARAALQNGVCAMHDASEGGIFGAIWELAEGAGTGLTIDLKKLPLRQETVEVCECCNRNPYELLSGGCVVMTAEDGAALVEALEAAGIPAVVVGRLTDSNDRIILNEDEVRYMDRPRTDEIYK